MKVKKIDKLMVAGLSCITNNENELNEKNAKIPALWNDYQDKNIYGKTFNKSKSFSMYGVYADYENEEKGEYKVTIAVEVTKPKNAIVIENQRYLVFSKEGELPKIVMECWKDVWEYFDGESEYERSFKIDFEKYSKEDYIEIFVSIKE